MNRSSSNGQNVRGNCMILSSTKHYAINLSKDSLKNISIKAVVLSKIKNFYCHAQIEPPHIGELIVAGYNWIFMPEFIFAGHFFNRFYNKFNLILTDSANHIRILKKYSFRNDCFLFILDFKISSHLVLWKAYSYDPKISF